MLEVGASPRPDGKLPKVIGGRCEYTGYPYNSEKAHWFAFVKLLGTTEQGRHEHDVPVLIGGPERLPDRLTKDLNVFRNKLVEQGKITVLPGVTTIKAVREKVNRLREIRAELKLQHPEWKEKMIQAEAKKLVDLPEPKKVEKVKPIEVVEPETPVFVGKP